MTKRGGAQLSFTDVEDGAAGYDAALRETTFVVVDLETTGGSRDQDAITEIGAVKVRGGEVLGEFATLVDPGRPVPAQIVHLTGITTAMLRDAPTIDAVLPMFLEFSRGAVLVAHNSGFDIGFLKAAAGRCQLPWPNPPVLCTVKLARRVLTREEAPSVRLAELARLFRTASQPSHRALDDARATVEVLHGLIERVGNIGVHSYADLRAYLPNVTAAQRRKRALAADLPHRPGVYLFRGPAAEVLYIGTATDLCRRVGQYFTGADPRTRLREMVALATSVDHVECAHPLEAGVRELRLLAAHAPPYNRRSRFPQRWWWLALSDEPFPRLKATRTPRCGPDGCAPREMPVAGPFASRTDAVAAADLLARFTGLRTCTNRLGRTARHGPACPEREVAGCPAGRNLDASGYAPAVSRAADVLTGADSGALAEALRRVDELAAGHRYESAARLRDRAAATIETLWRGQRLAALAAVPELVAAAPDGAGGWQLAVIRRGQLAAAGNARRGVPPMPVVEALCAGAQTILPGPAPLGGALVEETGLLVRWLATRGVRIVRTDQGWCSPIGAAGRFGGWAATARSARAAAEQLGRSDADITPRREQPRPGLTACG